MVQCPKWANLPPNSLAYIKGAVRRRSVQCVDLNHDLLKRCMPDYRRCWTYQDSCSDILPFMTEQPDFTAFEKNCRTLSKNYASVIDDWVDRLKDFGIVGFSLYQDNLAMSAVLSRRLRREHKVVCLSGGPSINMDSHVFLRRLLGDGTFDLGVLGIAEDVIDELLERIIAADDLADVPGLAVPTGAGDVCYTRAKPPDLSRYSPPDYGDFDLEDYYQDRAHWLNIYAAIGCLGNCEFCTIHEFYPGYKHKPVEHIQNEMLALGERYGKNHFFFSDGMFLGNRDDALAMFDFAIAHGMKLGLQIRLLPYWDDEELVQKASQCVFYLQVGFESASDNVRKAMRKMVDQERTKRIYQRFYNHQIPLYTNIIVGYPNETAEDFEQTCRFLEEYLTAANRVVGSNSFFVPNGFPTEKYNIRIDAAGHWASDIVDVYDRLERVVRMCGVAEGLDRSHTAVYTLPGVEGLPLDSLSPPPEELREICVERYVESPATRVGDASIAVAERYVQARGFAKLPDANQAGEQVILVDPNDRIVARATVNHDRRDVADHFRSPALLRSGWICLFRKTALDCSPHDLRAYLYTASDRTAWRLATLDFVPRQLDKVRALLMPGPPHYLRDRVKPTLVRGIRALPGGPGFIRFLRGASGEFFSRSSERD